MVAGLGLQQVELGSVAAYVLLRGSETAIVDTGTPGSADAIIAALQTLSVGPETVRHVVLTHDHSDHAGGLAGLEESLTAATVYVGAPDRAGVSTSLPLVELRDGDEVFGMGVVGTPGHTPGSISLFDTASGILVAGDAVGGDGAGGLVGPNPRFSDDLELATSSVGTLAALMPTIAAFGHGGEPVAKGVAEMLAGLS